MIAYKMLKHIRTSIWTLVMTLTLCIATQPVHIVLIILRLYLVWLRYSAVSFEPHCNSHIEDTSSNLWTTLRLAVMYHHGLAGQQTCDAQTFFRRFEPSNLDMPLSNAWSTSSPSLKQTSSTVQIIWDTLLRLKNRTLWPWPWGSNPHFHRAFRLVVMYQHTIIGRNKLSGPFRRYKQLCH